MTVIQRSWAEGQDAEVVAAASAAIDLDADEVKSFPIAQVCGFCKIDT